MAEYIKREDAIDAVLDVYYNTPDIDLNGEQLEAAILKVQPTYIATSGRLRGVTYEDGNVTSVHIMDTDDVVKVFAPVRHAKWVDNHCTACGMMPMGDEMWKNRDFEPPLFERFMDYCPNCGARMT